MKHIILYAILILTSYSISAQSKYQYIFDEEPQKKGMRIETYSIHDSDTTLMSSFEYDEFGRIVMLVNENFSDTILIRRDNELIEVRYLNRGYQNLLLQKSNDGFMVLRKGEVASELIVGNHNNIILEKHLNGDSIQYSFEGQTLRHFHSSDNRRIMNTTQTEGFIYSTETRLNTIFELEVFISKVWPSGDDSELIESRLVFEHGNLILQETLKINKLQNGTELVLKYDTDKDQFKPFLFQIGLISKTAE